MGEISIEHRLAGNKGNRRARVAFGDGLLVAAKKEQLVVHDRPAEGAAKLIAFQSVAGEGKWIPGIEDSVANKFESAAVKAVAAGFGHQIHYTCCVIAIAGGYGAGLHLEFLE